MFSLKNAIPERVLQSKEKKNMAVFIKICSWLVQIGIRLLKCLLANTIRVCFLQERNVQGY